MLRYKTPGSAIFIKWCAAMFVRNKVFSKSPFTFYRVIMYVIQFLQQKFFEENRFGIKRIFKYFMQLFLFLSLSVSAFCKMVKVLVSFIFSNLFTSSYAINRFPFDSILFRLKPASGKCKMLCT